MTPHFLILCKPVGAGSIFYCLLYNDFRHIRYCSSHPVPFSETQIIHLNRLFTRRRSYQDLWLLVTRLSVVQTVESPKGLSGKIYPKVVSGVIRLGLVSGVFEEQSLGALLSSTKYQLAFKKRCCCASLSNEQAQPLSGPIRWYLAQE